MDVYLTVDRNAEYVAPQHPTRQPTKEPTWPQLVAVIASTHHPFYYRASTATGEDRPPFADAWVDKIEAFRETLTRARPDVLVMVGSDHFHQLWLDNMPQFLVGKAPFYDANFYNEEREFGLPRMLLAGTRTRPPICCAKGSTPVSTWPSATSCGSTTRSPARSSRCGRKPTCRSCRSTPTSSRPRCRSRSGSSQLGRAIREIIESWPADQRVAVIGTGHLSLELGGPRQFGAHGPDPEFDRRAVEWIASGDIEGCLSEVTLDSLHAPATPPTASWTSC